MPPSAFERSVHAATAGRPATGMAPGGDRAPRSPTLFGAMVSRAFVRLAGWTEQAGRGALYISLLLVAFQAVRLPGNIGSVADPFLLFSLLCAVFLSFRGQNFNARSFMVHGIGLLLVLAGVLVATVARATDEVESYLNLSKFVFTTTGTFFACTILIRRRAQLKTALGCWVISAALSSVVALLQLWWGDAVVGYADQSWGRMPGLSANPNGLGAVAGMAVAPALSLAAASQRSARVLWIALALTCLLGVVISASRAGAIVAAVGFLIWVAFYARVNKELTLLLAGCCLVGAALAIFYYVQFAGGEAVTDRLASATDPYADGAVASRLYQYEAVLRDAVDHPILGTGLAKRDAEVHGNEIHNTFLMLLKAGGLLSFFGIMMIFGDLLRQGWQAYGRAHTNESRVLIVGLLLATVGLILTATAGPVLYQRMLWIPGALLFATVSVVDRRHRGARSRGAPHSRRKHSSRTEAAQSAPATPTNSARRRRRRSSETPDGSGSPARSQRSAERGLRER